MDMKRPAADVIPEETLDPDDWTGVRRIAHGLVDDAVIHLRDVRGRPAWRQMPNEMRARFRTGSFNAMQIIREKSKGLMVADLVALIASLDVVAPEIDR